MRLISEFNIPQVHVAATYAIWNTEIVPFKLKAQWCINTFKLKLFSGILSKRSRRNLEPGTYAENAQHFNNIPYIIYQIELMLNVQYELNASDIVMSHYYLMSKGSRNILKNYAFEKRF